MSFSSRVRIMKMNFSKWKVSPASQEHQGLTLVWSELSSHVSVGSYDIVQLSNIDCSKLQV